jgi:hypothetical protein
VAGTINNENSTPVENGRKPAPSREDNRSSYSLSADYYEMVWKEAKRLNIALTAAVNVLLDELRQYRSGERRFMERRKVPR